MKLTKELKDEYTELFKTMEPLYDRYSLDAAKKIISRESNYKDIEKKTGVPWYAIGCIHYMEGGLSFSRQLFNGERWNQKTTMVPKGLGPWDNWHDSAVDAMKALSLKHQIFTWSIPKICYIFESHNGWGYRKHHSHVKSPYLWSFSNHYKTGKYIADGKWSDTARSKQLGAMVIIKRISESVDIFQAEPESKPEPEPVPEPSVQKTEPPVAKPKKKNWWGKVKCWWKQTF